MLPARLKSSGWTPSNRAAADKIFDVRPLEHERTACFDVRWRQTTATGSEKLEQSGDDGFSSVNPIFKTAEYRRLWFNATTNSISYGGDFVLIGWMTLSVTGTTAWVGVAFALYYLPMVLLSIPVGSIADRFDRRRLIQALELVSALLIGVFALLFWRNEMALREVLGFTFCLGSLRAIYNPLRLSFTYDLVGPHMITPALAGVTLGVRLGMLTGALLISTLAERVGFVSALIVMTSAHLAAWLSLVGRFETGSTQCLDRSPLLVNLRAYLRELKTNRALLVLTLVTSWIEVFGASHFTVLPELAESRLALGVQGLGWMHAAQACGGLIISSLLFLVPQRRSNVVPYAASLICLGVSLVALGYVQSLTPMLLVLATNSAMITSWDIYTQSMIQLCVADRLRGRAMGTWVFAIGSAPLGHLQIGFLAAATHVETALFANGLAVIAILAIALLITPALRRL